MKKIRKPELPPAGRVHKQRDLPDDLLRFSFKYADLQNQKFNVRDAVAGYLPCFLERLQSVSAFTVGEFRTNKDRSLRAHTHAWDNTTEPKGFTHLNPQLQDCDPWQFQLTANEHGRIHGFIIDEVFYVIWFDPQHRLYA